MKVEPVRAPKNWRELPVHPLAELIEFGVGIDIDALAGYIAEHGYDASEYIVLYEGQILDGRSRRAACMRAEAKTEKRIIPSFAEFQGKNPAAYVGKKLHRQHLTESHRAMMGAHLSQIHGTAAEGIEPTTQREAAELMNVSRRSIQNAQRVQEDGSPDLVKAVNEGIVTVNDAVKVVGLPPEKQKKAVEKVREGKARTVVEAIGKRNLPRPSANGEEVYNLREFANKFGALWREIDDCGNAFKAKESPEASGLRRLLAEFKKGFEAWYKDLKKKE